MVEMDGSGFTFNAVTLNNRKDQIQSTIQPNMIDRSDFCHNCDLIIELEDDDQHYFKNSTDRIHFRNEVRDDMLKGH